MIDTPLIISLITTVVPDPIGEGDQEVVDLMTGLLGILGGPKVSGMNVSPPRGGGIVKKAPLSIRMLSLQIKVGQMVAEPL